MHILVYAFVYIYVLNVCIYIYIYIYIYTFFCKQENSIINLNVYCQTVCVKCMYVCMYL